VAKGSWQMLSKNPARSNKHFLIALPSARLCVLRLRSMLFLDVAGCELQGTIRCWRDTMERCAVREAAGDEPDESEEEMTAARRPPGKLFGVAQNFRFNRAWSGCERRSTAGAYRHAAASRMRSTLIRAQAPRKWITDPTLARAGPLPMSGGTLHRCAFVLCWVRRSSLSPVARKDESSGKVMRQSLSLQLEMTGGIMRSAASAGRVSHAGRKCGERRVGYR